MSNLARPQELQDEIYPRVIRDLESCALRFNSFQPKLRTSKAKEYCRHGIGRRVLTLRNSLERILTISPPTREQILNLTEKADLTAHLHCFFINNSGMYNNLACIWFYEKLSAGDKKNCPFFMINLFNSDFQKHLPQELVAKCVAFSDWYGYLKDFRDPLVHRIPFYVVPYVVLKKDMSEYKALGKKLNSESDPYKIEEIMNKMNSLGIYTGTIVGSFKKGKPMPLHQVVTDAITLLDLIDTYLKVF